MAEHLVHNGAVLTSVAKGFFIPSPAISLATLARVLCFRGTLIEIFIAVQAVRLLMEVAEVQTTRNREQGFRSRVQQDMEKHAAFTQARQHSPECPPMHCAT